MSDKASNSQEPENSEDEDKPSYEVGYRKPPAKTQFKKGQSGNIKGRPKGAKNKPKDITGKLHEIVLKETSRTIKIHDGNGSRIISLLEATIKSITMKAVKGDYPSQRLLTTLVKDAEKLDAEQLLQAYEIAMSFKLQAQKEIRNAKAMNQPEPLIIPHPEHIIFDVATQRVKILGPLDEKLVEKWNLCFANKLLFLQMLSECYQLLAEEEAYLDENGPDEFLEGEKQCLLKDIQRLEERIEKYREIIPDDIYIPPSTEEYCHTFLASSGYKFDEVKQLLLPH